MPTYDFKCEECGGEEEVFLKIASDSQTFKCSKCGGKTKVVINNPPCLKFKGYGWFTNERMNEKFFDNSTDGVRYENHQDFSKE